MTKDLVIVGSASFAQLVRDYFVEFTDKNVVAFSVHKKFIEEKEVYSLPLTPLEEITKNFPPDQFDLFVAIGYGKMNSTREKIYSDLKELGYSFATFIYPSIKIWSTNKIGDNVFIFEDNTIQPYVHIGNNTVLWSGNHIGHHSKIGDHCFISSHVVISGHNTLGDNIFMGVNSTTHDSITIGNKALIAAGALITRNVSDKEVYTTSPAKIHKKDSKEIGF
jgi:sugar O-acyltransferase (sialic acid O-acetyltransferase NeuD family)